MPEPLFQTKRTEILNLYRDAEQPFIASTQPYHSTQAIQFDVVETDLVNGLAFAVANSGQRLNFFSYGVGDRVTLGNILNFQASEAETNLAQGKSTNGASDFVIEGIGMSARALLVKYTDAAITAAAPTDPYVIAAFAGQTPMWDPASIVVPPQGQAPANLENGLFQSILPFLSVEFEWDRKRTVKLGVCDLLPQGGAASYLRANGVPDSENRWRIPEGYLWRRDGEPDGEFIARCTLERDLVVPFNLRTAVDDPTEYYAPDNFIVELVMRVYGLEVQLPSSN